MILAKNGMSKIYWNIVPLDTGCLMWVSICVLCIAESYLGIIIYILWPCLKVHARYMEGSGELLSQYDAAKVAECFDLCFPDASSLNLKDADEDNSSRVFFHNNEVAVSNLDFSSNALQGLPTGRRFFLSLMETVSHPSTSKLRKPSMIPPSVL